MSWHDSVLARGAPLDGLGVDSVSGSWRSTSQ